MNPLRSNHLLFTLSVLIFAHGAPRAGAQGDNFDDGDSAGWSELSPLAGFGVPGTFSFPGGNQYRMQAGASPDEASLGPSRVGALREDVSYTDFYMSVDLVGHDLALDQNIGLLARVRQPGLGTLDGYGVTYNPTDQAMFFTVITDEGGPNLDFGDATVAVNSGEPVRLVFQGKGNAFKFEIFRLADLSTAAASFEITDNTYTSGTCGLFVVTDRGTPHKPVDCTFDNYFAAAEEPVDFRVLSIRADGGDLVFDFLSRPGQSYSLWISDDLKAWAEFDDGIVAAAGAVTTHRYTPDKGVPVALRQFFQFRKPG